METKHWTDRLSDYLDGDLPPDEVRALESHLERCGECRTVLDELRAVVERARTLPDRGPSRDLWPAIRAEIAPGRGRSSMIDLTALRRGRPPSAGSRRRRISLSVPQLVAAALALMLLSGAGAWMVRPGEGPSAATGPATPPGLVRTAADAGEAEGTPYAEEVAELEAALAAAREQLAPNTVRILEKNLAVIDRAIEESRRALAVDPGNPFLESHLDRAYRRKVEYLRQASMLVETAT